MVNPSLVEGEIESSRLIREACVKNAPKSIDSINDTLSELLKIEQEKRRGLTRDRVSPIGNDPISHSICSPIPSRSSSGQV